MLVAVWDRIGYHNALMLMITPRFMIVHSVLVERSTKALVHIFWEPWMSVEVLTDSLIVIKLSRSRGEPVDWEQHHLMAKNINTLVFKWFFSVEFWGRSYPLNNCNSKIQFVAFICQINVKIFPHFFKDWFQLSKGLSENFKASYNEQVCPVREYNYVSQSDSMNSDDSTSSVNTNQTDCSVSIDVNDPEDLYVPLSSSSSQVPSEEVQQVSD